MLKYTKHSLKKLEELFVELGYQVRYEKGSFQSGYCMVENRNIAVINKFFDTEARINVLLEILDTIAVVEEELTDKMAQFYKKIKKAKLAAAEAESEEISTETTENTPTS